MYFSDGLRAFVHLYWSLLGSSCEVFIPFYRNRSQRSSRATTSCHFRHIEWINWCTTTYKSMACSSDSERIWQTTIPNLSLRHPALRQGLLALSALHLVSITTSSRRWEYLDTARSHQAQALMNLRPDDDTSDLSKSECSAIFASWLANDRLHLRLLPGRLRKRHRSARNPE